MELKMSSHSELIINPLNSEKLQQEFFSSTPFNHVVIDNFWSEDFAMIIASELPDYNTNETDANYDNPIEKKKTIQDWVKFPKNVYKAFSILVGHSFTSFVGGFIRQPNLVADFGLHGGGIHMHKAGDYLNAHYDYDIHPKMDMQRKLNIIIYMQPDWKDVWGGNLGLWSHDSETNQPKELIKSIVPKFNRAVIFDTTQNSWHGVTEGIFAPEGIYRRSLAAYYLIPPLNNIDLDHSRKKALFVPRPEQRGNKDIEDFCLTQGGV